METPTLDSLTSTTKVDLLTSLSRRPLTMVTTPTCPLVSRTCSSTTRVDQELCISEKLTTNPNSVPPTSANQTLTTRVVMLISSSRNLSTPEITPMSTLDSLNCLSTTKRDTET